MTKTKTKTTTKDKKNTINIEITNKVNNNAENNNHSKNKNERPESEEVMDTENNNIQPEYTKGPNIINNMPAYEPQSQLLRPNMNDERNYAPNVTINNEGRYFEEQTRQRIFGSDTSDGDISLPDSLKDTNDEEDDVPYSAGMNKALLKSILKSGGFKESSKLTLLGSRRLNDLYKAIELITTINEKRSIIRGYVNSWKVEKPNLFN
jgi:hypothetical protein